jgi:hypothetical protein
MAPAQQGFQTVDVAAGGILRLVMQLELAEAQGFAQLLLHAVAIIGLDALLGAEEVQASGFLVAQTVHGALCLLQQLGGGAGVGAEQSGADIGLQHRAFVAELVAAVQAFLQTLSQTLHQHRGHFDIRG